MSLDPTLVSAGATERIGALCKGAHRSKIVHGASPVTTSHLVGKAVATWVTHASFAIDDKLHLAKLVDLSKLFDDDACNALYSNLAGVPPIVWVEDVYLVKDCLSNRCAVDETEEVLVEAA